jgi:hypothetical protein
VNGRKLELKSIDDSYEPEKTIVATNKAITPRALLWCRPAAACVNMTECV